LKQGGPAGFQAFLVVWIKPIVSKISLAAATKWPSFLVTENNTNDLQ
jgi:hypothetical protein